MPRNLDLTALRSFVTVADTGGVTRAAGVLNLTQSAVSMQLKRLEELVGVGLIDRSSRTIGLTTAGEQLLGYARRMIDANDEAIDRLTSQEYEGSLILGVPHDIVYPIIPHVLRYFAAEFPRVQLQLLSSYTRDLKVSFAEGGCDLILTTEDHVEANGETLAEQPLVWVGARGGTAWRDRPLRLSFENSCIFRRSAQDALDRAGIAWDLAAEAGSVRTVEALVAGDLAVTAQLLGTEIQQLAPVPHGGALPDLGTSKINMYVAETRQRPAVAEMAEMLRASYRSGGQGAWSPAHRSGSFSYESESSSARTSHAWGDSA